MNFPETGCRQGYKVESMIGVNFYFSCRRCPVFVYPPFLAAGGTLYRGSPAALTYTPCILYMTLQVHVPLWGVR